MKEQLLLVSKAYNKMSKKYDKIEKNNELVKWCRKRVRSQVLKYARKECKILELNAGTGKDAVFLANKGYYVHATDISSGMLSVIDSKIQKYKLHKKLTTQKLSYTSINKVYDGPYDVILSNFGGLNCISDLKVIARNITPQILKMNGYIIWVIMPPICPWEIGEIFLSRRTALRRLPSLVGRGSLAKLEGISFMTYYYTPRQVMDALGNEFTKVSLFSLSVFSPPMFLDDFPKKHLWLYNKLRLIDRRLLHTKPFNSIGDFFVLTMKYIPKQE